MSHDLSELLFSYGTLQLESVQVSTFGRRLTGEAATLSNYRVEMLAITDPSVIGVSGSTDHPIAVFTAEPLDEVRGTVFEVTQAEIEAADGYEVSDYKRTRVTLRSGKVAWAYVKA